MTGTGSGDGDNQGENKEKGITTLGQVLSMTPGFYIGNNGMGEPAIFKRGIPDSCFWF